MKTLAARRLGRTSVFHGPLVRAAIGQSFRKLDPRSVARKKEPGTDIRSSVAGGTQVVSDWVKVRIVANPGETFLDRMVALVEGAKRQKTPNEIALSILLAGLTIVFLLAVATLRPVATIPWRSGCTCR